MMYNFPLPLLFCPDLLACIEIWEGGATIKKWHADKHYQMNNRSFGQRGFEKRRFSTLCQLEKMRMLSILHVLVKNSTVDPSKIKKVYIFGTQNIFLNFVTSLVNSIHKVISNFTDKPV